MSSSTEASEQPKPQENKNAVKINAMITKLVETIEKRIKAGQTDKDLEELKQLKEQCGSEDPLVSVTACHGLVHLVKSSVCPLNNTISALVASLFSVKSITGVASALTDLLVLELRCQVIAESSYKCPYNTKAPQHPLVAILKRRPQAWADVLNHVSAICAHTDAQVHSHSLELVKPVLTYVLTEATDLPDSSRLQAFKVITNYFSDNDFLIEALASCLCWGNNRVLHVVEIVTSLGQAALNTKHGLQVSLCCLTLAALVPRLLQAAVSPHPVLRQLSVLASAATNTHSTLLALLAASIPSCPAPYLEHLLTFFVEILGQGQCSLDCVWMCVSALMPWLASNSSHLHKALHTATLIVNHASATSASTSTTVTLIGNPAVAALVSADPRLTQALHIARLSEVLRMDNAATIDWLQHNTRIELDQLHLYVSALLISRSEPKVRLAALQTLVDSKAPMAISHNLTLFLYQLARETEPDIQLALLRALPSTALDKNNVMGVVSTLEALRRSGQLSLALLAVDLYCQLWMNQERCFPQLMDILNQDLTCFEEPCLAHLLQANVCKAICEAKPEMHGKEVVAKVSDLLNRCSAPGDAAASAVALDSLVPLCRHDVVDVLTIWQSLSPRFSRDKRPLVLKSLCELVSVAAAQKSAGTETDEKLAQILRWLWNLVGVSKYVKVVDAALKALSKFRLDQMTLKMLPECFRKGLTLPPELVKTPADAARKPEDVLDYIPGECWVQVLQHVGRESASLALAEWVKAEVSSFRGTALYQVDRQEPTGYSHLPRQSVIRGLVTSLRAMCKESATHTKTINLCLVALLQPTPKPLPSMSWAFLQDLQDLGDSELTMNVARLVAKQSQISPSARKITECFIASCGNDKEKTEFLYSILANLCRGIPPTILRPFVERTLGSAVNQKDGSHFTKLIDFIKTTLKEERIHDANRTMLQQQIKALWDVFQPQSQMLPDYFSCVSELPVSVTESMTSTSLMWEVTSAQLQKAFRLRAFMALVPDDAQPLNWMNEIIEVASSNIAEQSLALQLVGQVITQLRTHPTAWAWLLDLMGQTHLSSANNKVGVEFLVTVFVLSVDILSGFSSLAPNIQESGTSSVQDTRALRFPQAVTSLVLRNGDTSSMVEWLTHIRGCDSFPSRYSTPFQLAARNVSALRC